MKVICAPDSFKESLTAIEAADAMAAGVSLAVPDAEIDRCPVGDGGEGTLESLLASVDGQWITTKTSNVFGRTVESSFGLLDGGKTAYIESASAIGLARIPQDQRNVMHSSSFGVGQLVRKALEHSPEKVIVGVGGSATNDCGCGMAQALGVRFFDTEDKLIVNPISAGMLADIHRIDAAECPNQLTATTMIVACDVNNTLTGPDGAAFVFAPQKGASETQVKMLDDGLRHVAGLIKRDLSINVENIAGAGAAGGLGAGMIAFAGADVVSGIDTVLEAVQFSKRVRNADLCFTGEGCLDEQSLSGKACIGVAKIAARHGVTTIALVGRIGPGASRALDAGITEYIAISENLDYADSIRRAATLLTIAAEAVTRKYR